MARRSQNTNNSPPNNTKTDRMPPAYSQETRENQLIALAIDRAEEQLRNGTASPSVIAHFLRLGSTKERLEKDILAQKRELMEAQTEAVKSAKRVEELYANALIAMRYYQGHDEVEEIDEDIF